MIMEILIGPIASGKSTYARKRAEEGAVVVCDDAIVLAVHGGVYSLYTDALKPLYTAVEVATVTGAAAAGRDLVIDSGGRTRSRRVRFASLGRSLGYDVKPVYFEWKDPAVHAQRRHAHDPRGLTYEKWLDVARRHEADFQPVAPWEDLH